MAPRTPVLARDEAFELLYRSYVKHVYHYALAMLRNPADAEDVTQTTFMNAYRAYKRGDVIEKPQNWLIKIAHNVARTRYAYARRRVREVPLEEHVDQLAVPETERPNVEGVLRALGRLPFNQRAALVMRELEGRTYAEIADTIGVSVPAVETLIFRARRSVRLRASALQVLGAVPLPGSLAQLLEGGGVVAGTGSLAGGGSLGGGLLVKTAVAVIAGTVVGTVTTGIGTGHGDPSSAAPIPSSSLASARVSRPTGAGGTSPRRLVAKIAERGHARALVVEDAAGAGAGSVAAEQARVTPSPASTVQAAGGAAPAIPSLTAPTTLPSTPTPTPSQVVSPVTSLTAPVEQTVASTAASLPVQPPGLPPLPVQVPPAPKLP